MDKPHNQAEWYERLMFAPDSKNETSQAKQDAEETCLVRQSHLKKQFPAVRMTSACAQTIASVVDTVLRTILARCHVHRGQRLPPVLTAPILDAAVRSLQLPRLALPPCGTKVKRPKSRTPRRQKKSEKSKSSKEA